LFLQKEESKEGIYGIWINDGDWRLMTVDDYFLCYDKHNGPVYSKCKNHELWVLLLEKVYAKIYGSYAAIEVGDPCKAFRDLTGASTVNIAVTNAIDTYKTM